MFASHTNTSALWVAFLCLLVVPTALAQGIVEGTIRDASGTAIPFANIGLQGSTVGTAANLTGQFRLVDVAVGTHTLVASAVGFQTIEQTITIQHDQTTTVDFVLAEAVIETDGIVVTGTMMETFVRDSPVKVNVVSPNYLEKIPTANIMEVLENVNGLYQQIDCGVCGTNNIRINGMDGPYTAVLIDGMPIMSSLATVYGLNGISPALIQQIEVIKGPMSTLYGSEALGGVINIITKTPVTAPRLSVNTFGTSQGEYALDVGIVPSRGRFTSLVSGTLFYNNRYLDGNSDNFADLTLSTRGSLFGKAALTRPDGNKQLDLSARYYYEDRLGGTEAFIDAFRNTLRGSDEFYGETIRTHRAELIGSYHLNPKQGTRLDVAFNYHDQDSYYGSDSYQASQATAFAQLIRPIAIHEQHSILTGATLRAQRYDDNTGSTGLYDDDGLLLNNRPDDRLIPGVFVQHEWVASERVRFLSGMRADYQQDYGIIPSPRLSLKLNPAPQTTLRLNGGTGFRIVNLFTEDHAAYSGARATVLLEDLKPERSYSSTAALQHIIDFGANPLTIDVEGFYTYFTNKIEPDYDTPGLIVYQNLDGSATTRGVSLTLSQSFTVLPLSYTLGGTVMDVFVEDNGERGPLEFAPEFQGVVNATYSFRANWSLDYTMNLTGPMHLPEYEAPFARPTTSPTFSIHNLKLSKELPGPGNYDIDAYISVENLFDYTQAAPLIDPTNPFGPNFDTAYVYGPISGRAFGFGIRVTLAE